MKRIVATICCAILLQACAAEMGAGFHLPQGDPARGREAFVALRCQSCHFVETDGSPVAEPGAGRVGLGGDTARVRTYGDLVTSIVNPSHEVAREYIADQREKNPASPMASAFLNDVVTVQQLVDIVAFLQDAYNVVPPPVIPYWEKYPSRRPGEPGAVWPR
jgi:L-cysteine S-thiosulfotransferase